MSRFANKTQPQTVSLASRNETVALAYISLQRTQRGLIGMVIACAVLGFTVFPSVPGALGNRTFLPVIISTSLLAFAFTTRNAMVLPALADLRRNPRSPEVLKRWSRNNLIVLSLCAAMGLLGFAMQLMGAPVAISLTMYAIAVVYLFLLGPSKP